MSLPQTLWRAQAEFQKIPTSMKGKGSQQAVMSTSLRVSPSIHGYHFDTASRKKAVGNIFENVDQESLQRLFKNSGDKKAEERAKIIFTIDQDLEEKTRALMALKRRTKDKLFQFLKLRKYSIQVH
ncbi:transcriptional and immune response regulator [Octodon degus]|uniref:Transcriptional and immune response regulator n=1 Tax=Octodon degus TaxID=10160 RepID=A0A6P6ELZ4_OCTDE|nr:transcriptional and immune response regulator [Octodon degus]